MVTPIVNNRFLGSGREQAVLFTGLSDCKKTFNFLCVGLLPFQLERAKEKKCGGREGFPSKYGKLVIEYT